MKKYLLILLLCPVFLCAYNPLEGRIFPGDKRYETFDLAFKLLEERGAKVLVETGTARHGDRDFEGDGGSTILFADWSIHNNALVYSVDLNAKHLEAAREATRSYAACVMFSHGDSIHFLKSFPGQIDFLYLDSFDYNKKNPKPAQKHLLKELKVAYDKLSPTCVVMIDDCDYTLDGKGKYAIKYLQRKGWKVIAGHYQVILSR